MARKLFEKQGIRVRSGALATGTVYVVYTDSAGTVLADISATSGGSAIAGSTVTVTDRATLGLATLLFYGPTDGTDTLYLRCPADTSLGVQEIEADEDERLDALVLGSGIPPSLFDAKGDIIAASAADTAARLAVGANDTVLTADSSTGTGLKWAAAATDAELAAHEADTTAIHGIADTSALATTSGVTSAVSTHAGLTDPHTGYVLESLYDAKGDVIAASADNTPAKLTAGANDTVLTADSTTGTGLKWAAPAAHPNLATHDSLGLATDAELTTHAGAADPHTGYVLESLYDAKGDLIAASADNTPAKLTVGANDTILVADSVQSTGVKWAAVPTHASRHALGGADPVPGLAAGTIPFLRSGLYYTAPFGVGVTGGFGLNELHCQPLPIVRAVTIDRIGLEVTNPASATGVYRLGVYADDGNGYPGALVLDAGTIAADSNGVKQITISQALSAGLHWLAAAPQVAGTASVQLGVGSVMALGAEGGAEISANSPGSFRQASVSGALPANFSATVLVSTHIVKVFVRIA